MWILYFTELSSRISNTISTICILYFVALFLIGFIWCISNDGYQEEMHANADKAIKSFISKIWIIITGLVIVCIIPSKTTMYLMVGSNYLAQSNIPSQVSEIINYKLKDILAELKKEDK